MKGIEKIVLDERIRQKILDDNPSEQACELGPYRVTRGEWTYDADDVDAAWLKRKQNKDDVIPVSGQFQLVVVQADGFTKALLPYDEHDGHSAAEALHVLQALNGFDELLKAAREVVVADDSGDAKRAIDALRGLVSQYADYIQPGQNEQPAEERRPAQ